MFCYYVSDCRYGWVAFCEKQFRDVPSQICFEWNTPQHTTDDAVPPRRRAFAKAELQHLFDVVDDFVDEAHRNGSKRWLTALRDSTAFKIGYAYGLRRPELVMLDLTDLGPIHTFALRQLRRADCSLVKGTKGSGPRRRTVLTSPEFAWAVDLLQYWCDGQHTEPPQRGVERRRGFGLDNPAEMVAEVLLNLEMTHQLARGVPEPGRGALLLNPVGKGREFFGGRPVRRRARLNYVAVNHQQTCILQVRDGEALVPRLQGRNDRVHGTASLLSIPHNRPGLFGCSP